MSVVAPVTAVVSAIVPVVAGLALGERPGWLAMAGIVARRAGHRAARLGWIGRRVSRPPRSIGGSLVLAAAGGIGFGLFFVTLVAGLQRRRPLAGPGRPVALRGRARRARHPSTDLGRPCGRRSRSLSAGAGVLDTTANGLYLLAVQRGLLSEVAVLSSLYPASTIVLARTVLHERLARLQWWGLALAGVAVVAIAA